MALTLTEAAKLSTDDLQKGVLETFVQVSPVLDRIPFLEIEGNAYAYNEEATLPGVEFRNVNEAYSESTGTVNRKTESLVILGGDADVDTFIQKTRSNFNDQRATVTEMKVKAASYKFQDHFINGDVLVDTKGFDGLKTRLTGGQVISTATNGIPVLGTTSAERQTFFDKLDELIAAVRGGPDVLYADSAIIGKIKSAMRRENQYVERVGTKNEPSYEGIPLVDIGLTAAGSKIIPVTETQGSANDSSSIYAVKFGNDEGDQAVTGLTNGGVDVRDLGEQQSKPAYRTRVEFFTGLGVFGGKGAARLRGVRNA